MFFIETLSPLYEAVQLSQIFDDSKFFVDCVPKSSVSHILEQYERLKSEPDFDLKAFVTAHFDFPEAPQTDYLSGNKPIETHLNALWTVLERKQPEATGTLLYLPHAYIVPGGRFREIYYWDSYFTMLGLQVSQRRDMIENMVQNFAWLIQEVGFIPNGNRSYYLGRSQPPFFALMLQILREEQGGSVLLTFQKALEREYQFWMQGAEELSMDKSAHRRVVRMSDGSILNRYYDEFSTPRPEAYVEDLEIAHSDPENAANLCRHIRAAAESGWDFSSRWFRDGKSMKSIQTTDLIPVDLNCLLLFMEETLLQVYEMLENEASIAHFQQQISARKLAIQRYCWDEQRGFFMDYHFMEMQRTGALTLAGVFPLFFQVATAAQAQQVATVIDADFLKAGGLVTTLKHTGQQWDAPNGWAPLQWIAYKGLKNYGLKDLANQIKQHWVQNIEKVYAETGKMMEKYNVEDMHVKAGGGEYPNQDGFGWTNGVYLKMKAV